MSLKKLILVIGLLSSVLIIWSLQQCQPPAPQIKSNETIYRHLNDSTDYVGIAVCKSCHQEIYETYIKTGMGKSFRPANAENTDASFGNGHFVYDLANALYYVPKLVKDELWITEFQLSEDGDTTHKFSQQVNYIIGSGHHTNSHLIEDNGYLHQAPITYYTQRKQWDMAPGFEAGYNSRFSRIIALECMSCHNAMPIFDEQSEHRYEHIKMGIDCERCHGPGEIHVKEKLVGIKVDTANEIDYSILVPTDLNRQEQLWLCGRCHWQGVAVLEDEKTFDDYLPGLALTDFMNIFLPRYSGGEEQFLMASQADRLGMSKCFKRSDMSCVSCHNPHLSVQEVGNDFFNVKCQSCHQADNIFCSASKEDKEVENNNCTNCHMAKAESIDIPHVMITDHFIRKRLDQDRVAVVQNELQEIAGFMKLECLTQQNPSAISRAKAYLKFYENFNKQDYLIDSAALWLEKVETSPEKQRVMIHWLFLKNDYQKIFIDHAQSTYPDAWTNYYIGEAAFKLGNLKTSIQFLKKAVQLKPAHPDFKLKLARVYIKARKFTDVELLLNSLEPNYKKDEQCYLRAIIALYEGDKSLAKEYISLGLQFNPLNSELKKFNY